MSEKEWLEEILYDWKYPVDGDQLQQAAIYGIDKTLDQGCYLNLFLKRGRLL